MKSYVKGRQSVVAAVRKSKYQQVLQTVRTNVLKCNFY